MDTRDYLINMAKNPKQEEPKCYHDVGSGSSTLIKGSKRFMVHPEIQDYVCKVCHKTFRYTKHGDIYTLVKSD